MTLLTRSRITSLLLLAALLFSSTTVRAMPNSRTVGSGPGTCNQTALEWGVADAGTVTFDCGPGPVTIDLTREVRLQYITYMDGAGQITLDAHGNDRIFKTDSGSDIYLKNITLKNGRVPDLGDANGYGQGGAIYVGFKGNLHLDNVEFDNNEALTQVQCGGGGAIAFGGYNYSVISNSRFTGNKAQNGGAIYNLTADLNIFNSIFTGNQAMQVTSQGQCGGGAIAIDGAYSSGVDAIQITGSTFSTNTTNNSGGAIFAHLYGNDRMTIDQTTFDQNQATFFIPSQNATSGNGGAIWFDGENVESGRIFTSQVLVSNSTFSGNHADYTGGAIYSWDAPLLLTNVTLDSNSAKNTYSQVTGFLHGAGAGLAVGSSLPSPPTSPQKYTDLVNVTLTNNTAGNQGGGIETMGSGYLASSVRLANTIVAFNIAGSNQNCNKGLIDRGGNVQYPARQPTNDTNCISNLIADPKIATLGNNGGPTKTVAILSGSAAVDHAVASLCPVFDQRGYTRVGNCDSGAYEYGGKVFVPKAKVYIPLAKK